MHSNHVIKSSIQIYDLSLNTRFLYIFLSCPCKIKFLLRKLILEWYYVIEVLSRKPILDHKYVIDDR